MDAGLQRRCVLGMMGLAGIAAITGCATAPGGRRPFFQQAGLPIGLQVYTLGNEAATDVDATFASIAAIGYHEIELPNLLGRKPAELRAAADRAGLTISSLHVPITPMGAAWAVAPICLLPPGFRLRAGETFGVAFARSVAEASADARKRTAAMLYEQGASLRSHGIAVGHHNDNLEFAPIGNTTGWEILRRETDPALVHFEIDIGWVATAGLDPVAFLDSVRGRIRLMHVKDVATGNAQNFELKMVPTEVGAGILPFDRILPAALAAGCRHLYVEQEPPFATARIEAARRSFGYLAVL